MIDTPILKPPRQLTEIIEDAHVLLKRGDTDAALAVLETNMADRAFFTEKTRAVVKILEREQQQLEAIHTILKLTKEG